MNADAYAGQSCVERRRGRLVQGPPGQSCSHVQSPVGVWQWHRRMRGRAGSHRQDKPGRFFPLGQSTRTGRRGGGSPGDFAGRRQSRPQTASLQHHGQYKRCGAWHLSFQAGPWKAEAHGRSFGRCCLLHTLSSKSRLALDFAFVQETVEGAAPPSANSTQASAKRLKWCRLPAMRRARCWRLSTLRTKLHLLLAAQRQRCLC